MSISDEFGDNRDFLNPPQSQNIDVEAFKKFVEKHGHEVAKGYLLALNDMLPRIEEIYRTPNNVRKRNMAFELCEQINNLLHIDSNLGLDKKSNPNANMPPPSLS